MRRPAIPKRFLGAFKAGHRATSRVFIDEELSYKLLNQIIDSNWTDLKAIQELDYITKFNNEFHKDVFKAKDNLHNNQDLRKDCGDRNNARNRDILSRDYSKIASTNNIEHSKEKETVSFEVEEDSMQEEFIDINRNRDLSSHEDSIIDVLDLEIEYKKSTEH